jgi:kynurenine formamidase
MKTWGIVAGAAGASLLAVILVAMPQNSSAPKNVLDGIPSGSTRVIDLSYAINAHLPPWPGDKRTFEAQPNATFEKDGYFTRSFWMLEHYGTHIDAPIHFAKGGATVDQIPAEKLFGPGVVIDVRSEGQRTHDYALTPARIEEWEKAHGRIPEGAIVLLRTGWADYWNDAQRYRGLDEKGAMHFPGFSAEAVRVLLQRGVSGIGVDAMSVDIGASKSFEVHQLALGAGIWQLENLADLTNLPESGAYIIVAPIKLEGGSGGPCRVFAVLP